MPGSTPTVETVMWRAPMPSPRGVVEDRQRRVDRLPVHERLAHAHEHDVRRDERRVEQRELAHLSGDLERREVAREAHRAGRAERALQRAPRLRRDAERQAVAVGDRDGLDRLAVGEPEEELLRAVARPLPRGEREPRQLEVRGEQRRGTPSGSSVISSNDATGLLPQARDHLRRPVRGLPVRGGELAQRALRLVGDEVEQIDARRLGGRGRFGGHLKTVLSVNW